MNSQNQNRATVFSLQTYITELTSYINQNNAKYTKNLQTIKTFYQQQIQDLNLKVSLLEQQKLQLKNDLLPLKDILNNQKKELKDTKFYLTEFKIQNQSLRQKLNNQRLKIDQLYQEIQNQKNLFKHQLDFQEKLTKDTQNQKNDLLLKLKQKQHQISRLQKDIQRLQKQVSQRYSLPQKLKDIQIQQAKNKTLLKTLTETNKKLQTKLDFQSNQLQILREQNKRLQVNFESRDANAKKQVTQALAKEKQSFQEKLKRLESINEKQLFQINQLHNSLKSLKKQNSQLQQKLSQYIEELKIFKEKIKNHDIEKDKYIEEFQKLKHQYEQVIQNLQEAIPKYQKKNWDLQQQNRDLNVQLDGLRDVLTEVKAMNTLQPLRHEYRQIAEFGLIAAKQYQAYETQTKEKNELKKDNTKYQNETIQQKEESELKWDQLLADIDRIQV